MAAADDTDVKKMTGPVVGTFNENVPVDPRFIGVIGGVLSILSFIVASFSSSALQLFLSISIIGGIGNGLSYVQSTALVAQYFHELYPRASAIVASGTALGMIIFAPMAQLLLDTYGWRSTLLLFSAINAHLIPSGSLLRPVQDVHASYSPVKTNDTYADITDMTDRSSEKRKPIKKQISPKNVLKLLFPKILFTDPIYILHLFLYGLDAFILSGWFIYLVPHAVYKGFSPYKSVAISMISGFMSVIGSIVYFPLVERDIVKVRTLMYAGSILSALALLLDPWMNTFGSLTISSTAYLTGRCVFKSLFFVILKGNIGAERFPSAYGWCLAIGGIFRIGAGWIVGWLYDYTGSYDYGFLVLGGVQSLCICLMLAEDKYKNTRLENK